MVMSCGAKIAIAVSSGALVVGLLLVLALRSNIRERVTERVGKPGWWHLERAGTSRVWRTLNRMAFVARWLDDHGYEGERWWYVSPKGRRGFLPLLNGVSPDARDADAGAFVAAAVTNAASWGFGALGYGAPLAAWLPHADELPAVVSLSLNTWNAGLLQGVFEDWYASSAVKACEAVAGSVDRSPAVAGVLWESTPVPTPRQLLLAYAALKPESASKGRVVAFLREQCRADPRQLQARMPSVRSFEELAARVGWDQYEGIDQDGQAFARLVYSAYGAKVQQEVRARFPNYLNLGPLLDPALPVPVIQALAAYVDVLTFSVWSPDGRIPRRYLESVFEATGKPVLVLETGQKLLVGEGDVVRTPEGQAAGYRRAVRGAAALPFAVGAGWTGYRDVPANAWGFLDAASAPRAALVAAATADKRDLEPLHKAGLPPAELPEHFTDDRLAGARPSQSIPRLAPGFSVDGELEDWPRDAARLKSLRLANDLDASGFAEAFAAWNDEGLAVAVEVADETSELLDPAAYWRDADFAEFLIEASGRREEGYGPTTLHLALVPRGGGPDGARAVAIAVHHDGDAVKADGTTATPLLVASSLHGIPGIGTAPSTELGAPWRPQLRLGVTTWRIEALVPWKALGVAPRPEMRIGFNAAIRRMTGPRAEEMFWAMPRGEAGLDHPSTWGDLTLYGGTAR